MAYAGVLPDIVRAALVFRLGGVRRRGARTWPDARNGELPHAEFAQFVTEAARDTFENWQSEFLQLLWQVVGLAYFLYIGSPSSKENDDRLEAKVDELLKLQAGEEKGQKLIDELDHFYLREHGHAQPLDHRG